MKLNKSEDEVIAAVESLRAKLAQIEPRKPIILNTWFEANSNGGLVKFYRVKCQECGGIIARTTHKNTIYHMECGITRKRVKNTRKLKERISKMTLREKDKALLAALERLQEYESHYGLLIGKDHIRVTDPLIRAIADKGRYEKLNWIAGEWLEGE